jgi:Spy/CpxP family protein refolding chaperone
MNTVWNKKMPFALLLATALVFTAGGLSAREGKKCCGAPDGPGFGYHMGSIHHLEFMQKELGLSDQQLKDVFDITQKYRQKYFDNRGNVDKTLELRLEERKEIKKVLSAEQQKKFDDLTMRKGRGMKGNMKDCPYRNK